MGIRAESLSENATQSTPSYTHSRMGCELSSYRLPSNDLGAYIQEGAMQQESSYRILWMVKTSCRPSQMATDLRGKSLILNLIHEHREKPEKN